MTIKSADIRRKSVNNSITFTPLNIHGINGAGFLTSSMVVPVAKVVSAVVTTDSTSVVSVVEMVVADGVEV